MEKLNKKNLKRFAWSVFGFHLLILAIMFSGTIWIIFYPENAWKQLILIFFVAAFQSLGQGWCPLTWLENSIWEKSQPERAYWDPETYRASFIRHCLKRYLNIDAPEGTTTRLLILVLGVTLVQLFSIPLIVPEIITAVIIFYWFIKSRYWRAFAGYGPLNIIPSIIVWIMISATSLVTWIILEIVLVFVPEKTRYPLARITLSGIFEYFSGSSTEVVGEIAEGQLFCLTNHASFFDVPKIPKSMRKKTGEKWKVLADKILFVFPPFAAFLRRNGIKVIPITGKNKNTGMVRSMMRAIDEGYSLFIFHESKRSVGPDNFLLPCKPEIAKIASKTGVPIQLILFFLPKRFQPKSWKRPWIVFVPTKIIYGATIETRERKWEDIQKDVDQGMQAMLDEQLFIEKQ